MNVDIGKVPFTVAGVGDMSGDVFGNAMLLSPVIKLVAAFDHRDIFLDPDPDPAASLAERARLFALPRSGWRDYERRLLSTGGGIFPRSAKQIALSSEVQALLGMKAANATPQEVLRAILRAPVDLLWFGGIGTYVRASDESDEFGARPRQRCDPHQSGRPRLQGDRRRCQSRRDTARTYRSRAWPASG